MPDNSKTTSTQPDPHHAIVAALRHSGPRTAGQLAEHMGIPYSSLTPRLRQLEEAGRAERIKDPATRQTIWQVTADADSAGITAEDGPGSDPDSADDLIADDGDSTQFLPPNAAEAADEPSDDASGSQDTSDTSAEPTDPVSADVDDVGTDSQSPAEDPDVTSEAEQHDDTETEPGSDSSDTEGQPPMRRPKGAIPAAILEVTRAHPDDTFKVSQLRKALAGASAGAIANAANKLVVSGELLCVCEKPAAYKAA